MSAHANVPSDRTALPADVATKCIVKVDTKENAALCSTAMKDAGIDVLESVSSTIFVHGAPRRIDSVLRSVPCAFLVTFKMPGSESDIKHA